MLDHMLQRQKRFQQNFFAVDKLTPEEQIIWTKEFILCLHQELAEVMNTLKWKSYHSYDIITSTKDTQDELIDCFKFMLNLFIVWGIDDAKILELFEDKSTLVEQRFRLKNAVLTKNEKH